MRAPSPSSACRRTAAHGALAEPQFDGEVRPDRYCPTRRRSVDRNELEELHSIQAIDNVPSILQRGILSHEGAAGIDHISVADPAIQDRRAGRQVPGGQPLHQYANLYFHARNPMMFRRRGRHAELCVLRIRCDVLDLPDVVVTDGNASSDYIRFGAAADGLDFIDADLTFAMWWTDTDYYEKMRKKTARCAEVLVPDRVPPGLVEGAYVCGHDDGRLANLAPGLHVETDRDLFFC